jgi:hypothetical protein
MTNEELAKRIGLMAKAVADESYVDFRMIAREMTLEELRAAQRVAAFVKAEIDVYEERAS